MKNRLFYCTLKVQTFQKVRLLNVLSKAKITVFDLKIESNEITFALKIKDLPKTFAILKNMCYNYYVCSKHTVKSRLQSVLARSGFVLAFVCSLIFTSLCSTLVVGVKVNVEDVALRKNIEEAYAGYLAYPRFASTVDVGKIKESIRAIPSVAECSVKIKGNYLEVSVLTAPKQEERNPEYSSYVSAYDATVTEIIAHKGTPLVKVGQRVFAGSPLISPNAFNESGEIITATGIVGKVYGEIVLRKTLVLPKMITRKVKTGNTKEYTSLAFSRVVPPSPYALYEKVTQSVSFNIFLPVYYTKTVYEEIVQTQIAVDVDEVSKKALDEFAIEKGVVGQTQSYSYVEEDETYRISLYIKAITEIGIGE